MSKGQNSLTTITLQTWLSFRVSRIHWCFSMGGIYFLPIGMSVYYLHAWACGEKEEESELLELELQMVVGHLVSAWNPSQLLEESQHL